MRLVGQRIAGVGILQLGNGGDVARLDLGDVDEFFPLHEGDGTEALGGVSGYIVHRRV